MPSAPQGGRWVSGAPVATRTMHPRPTTSHSQAAPDPSPPPSHLPAQPPSPPSSAPDPATRSVSLGRRAIATLVGALVLSIVAATSAWTAPADAASTYLLISRSDLLARPTSGTAWSSLKSVADGSLGTANLCDQDEDHHLRTMAAALVYARTGSSSYKTKATSGIMAAIKTQSVGCGNAVLALARQLPAYVFAADFIDLSGTNETTFRSWLSAIRSKVIGGHSVWNSLENTQRRSANNWGAHAGAARIAASLYLGDTDDVSQAARIAQGFLGDRTKYTSFSEILDSDDLSWACGSASTYTPINKPCTKSGINVDGGVVADISRGGSLRWPPPALGISYQVETIAAMGIQLELLSRNGYSSAWSWSSSALKRAAQLVQRSAASGGDGWNESSASSQIPWLLNLRYGKFLPTRSVTLGRSIGFANWLWSGGSGGTSGGSTAAAPTVSTPWVRLSTTSTATTSGVPVVLGWSLGSAGNGLSRYQVQIQRDGTWRSVTLASSKATTHRVTLSTGSFYAVRVRAVDRAGLVGAWKTSPVVQVRRVDDASSTLRWSGSWSVRSASGFLGGKAHRGQTRDVAVSYTFRGTSIAWVSAKSTDMGQAFVEIDGKYIATVDLKASSSQTRRVVFARQLPDGEHTIRVRVVGTSGRPFVYVDAFYAIDPK
jgi:hypothetical protein